ncbi:MAG: hypothetical protein ACLFR1_01665 [Spirochaetia bacterium]
MKSKIWTFFCIVFLVLSLHTYGQTNIMFESDRLSLQQEQDEQYGIVDWYEIEVTNGQSLSAAITSQDFTPELILELPSGSENRYAGFFDSVFISVPVTRNGIARLGVTSVPDIHSTGSYSLFAKASSIPRESQRYPDYLTTNARFQLLVPNQTLPGILEQGDHVSSDMRYIDYYRIFLEEGTQYFVSLSSDYFDPLLTAYMSQHEPIVNDDFGSRDSGLFLYSERNASAVIQASSFQQWSSGNYQIRLIPLSSPDTLSVGRTVRGALEEDDQSLGSVYTDNYILRANESNEVHITLDSDSFDPALTVITDSGQYISNDDRDDGSQNSEIQFSTNGGIVQVFVHSDRPYETGSYTLSFISQETAEHIQVGSQVQASLSQDDQLLEGRYVDTYRISGYPGQHIIIDLRSQDFDSYLIIEDETGFTASNDDGGQGFNARIEYTFSQNSSELFIRATSLVTETIGDYSILVSEEKAGDWQDYVDGYRLEQNQVIRSSLTLNDTPLAGRLSDTYTFLGQAETFYRIRVQSSEFQPYVAVPEIRDAETSSSREDLHRETVLEFTPENTGIYILHISSESGRNTGIYSLIIESLGRTEILDTVEGELSQTDTMDLTGRSYDSYELETEAGQTYSIELTSNSFDPMVYVRTMDGRTLYSDNNSGPGNSARITFQAGENRTLKIIFTSFRLAENSGNYEAIIKTGSRTGN